MIEVRDLEKRYGDVRAVKQVSFDVGRGEIVGLLGHNGAGKSTVMKMITGYLEPSEGSVAVGGIDVLADRIGVQTQIGYLPENAPVYPEMLVQEYLLMMAELRSIPASERNTAVGRAVRSTGLENWLVRPISTLSKGYRQRVGLAQAILHDPEVLILDEPTSGLDPVQIAEIRGLIRRLASKSTVILSTHILSEIEAVCDRVIIMIDGVLATDSTMSDLLASDRVRLSIADGAGNVESTLGGIEGVREVATAGADPRRAGYQQWSLACTSSTPPTPEIVRAAVAAGWDIASVSLESQTLEEVFRELIDRYAAEARSEVAA
jgi:ABC-2 type transport system ATP-binding protein